MQQKYKHSFTDSRMQKDLDARLVSKSEYRDAMNVSVSRSEGADVGALENILGNELISTLQYTGETPCEVIGMYTDISDDNIFLFLTNYADNSTDKLSNKASYDSVCKIVVVNTQTGNAQTIVEGSFLNLSINSPIYHINMIEDLMFWTDNRNQPRQINTTSAINDVNYYVSEEQISVAKYYPYQPLKVSTDIVVDECVFVTAQIEGRTPSPATATWYGYDAIYDYFFIKQSSLSTTIINQLQDNLGTRGYVIDGDGNRFEFRLAWFQQDGATFSNVVPPTGAELFHDPILPSPYNDPADRKYLIFVDRALQATGANLTRYTAGTLPADPADADSYTIVFTEETSKDVSNPWREDDIGKFMIEGSAGSELRIQVPCVVANINNKLNAFGTRSWPITAGGQPLTAPTAGDPNYSAYQVIPGSVSSAALAPELAPFRISNGFPDNSSASSNLARNIYPRITHPKIPITDYVCFVTLEQGLAGNPEDSAQPSNQENITTARYSALSNGGTLDLIDVITEYGLAVDDIITIHWPNKFYNAKFPGDPAFLDDKFVRFSYRYKFDDGEYSLIAPFTQPVFIPKQGGYFRKQIEEGKASGEELENVPTTQANNWTSQASIAGQNTVVEFFANSVTEATLSIPLDYPGNELATKLKVSEIDILYKEADALSIKVVDSLPIEDFTTVTTNELTYQYQSRKPIKVLPDSEITRVYDNVPVRAAAQSSSGNRIIYGNFYDRHTSPPNLDYFVGVSPKLSTIFPESSKAIVAYPNHTLKQNRNYQVGIVLSDKYGRQSDVILSSVEDDTFIKDDGLYSNFPIEFGGSTVYSPYFDSVLTPNTTAFQPAVSDGIVTWPGDSLKVLFNSVIPSSISTNEGYPGLYEEPITTLSWIQDTAGEWKFASTTGNISLIKPGDILEWTDNNVLYTNTVKYVNVSGTNWFVGVEDPSIVPSVNPTDVTVLRRNELGWYSYKVVVKQNQQEYYNVYLPSLLAGEPVIKPFTLQFGTNIIGATTVELGGNTTDPKTFMLTEGCQFQLGGTGKVYTVINILTNDQFQINPALAAGTTDGDDVTFFTKPSTNRNVTTLLTDNTNKVPPSLNETTPVQLQYTTSDTELIPRVARDLLFDRVGKGPYLNIANSEYYSGPVFPKRETLKVTALGSFFNLFKDPKTAGLYEASTNPTAALIDNKFNIGTPSDDTTAWNALPDTEYPTNYAIYETTPTVSNIDIFWETSTVGKIRDLNQAILDDPTVPIAMNVFTPRWNENEDFSIDPDLVTDIEFVNFAGDPIAFADMNGGGPTFVSLKNLDLDDVSAGVTFVATSATAGKVFVADIATWSQYWRENANKNTFTLEMNVNINSPYAIDYNFTTQLTILNEQPIAEQYYPAANNVRGTDVEIGSGLADTTRTGGGSAVWTGTPVPTYKTFYSTTNGAWKGAGMPYNDELQYTLEFLDKSGSWNRITGAAGPNKMTGLTLVQNTDALLSMDGVVVSVGNVQVYDADGLNPETPESTSTFEFRISSKDGNGTGLQSDFYTYFDMNFVVP